MAGQFGAARIVIEGHSDASRQGRVPESAVEELSLNRANAVKEYLVGLGVVLPPLGVADDHVLAAELGQHRGNLRLGRRVEHDRLEPPHVDARAFARHGRRDVLAVADARRIALLFQNGFERMKDFRTHTQCFAELISADGDIRAGTGGARRVDRGGDRFGLVRRDAVDAVLGPAGGGYPQLRCGAGVGTSGSEPILVDAAPQRPRRHGSAHQAPRRRRDEEGPPRRRRARREPGPAAR